MTFGDFAISFWTPWQWGRRTSLIFSAVIEKCFPPNHKWRKLFNKNNLKLSYSCSSNIKQIIDGHNKTILSQNMPPQQQTPAKPCNCREPDKCPLKGQCLVKEVVYQATITTAERSETYVGLTATEQIRRILRAWPNGIPFLHELGWQEVWIKYWCLSVGLVYRSVVTKPSFKIMLVSRKFTRLYDQSTVNLIVLWNEFMRSISNGNRTEWSPIQSVIIRVITKSDDRAAGVRFVYHEYDYRQNWTTRSLTTN